MNAEDRDADTDDAAMFPVHLIVKGQNIWVGWRSTDEPGNALFRYDGEVLWANTKEVLIDRCSAAGQLRVEDETVFDLDALLAKLLAGKAVDGNEVINCWNMLIDIRGALKNNVCVSFDLNESALLNSYDHFLSMTSVGDMVGIGFHELTEADLANAAEVVSNGMLVLMDLVGGRSVHVE